MASMSSWMLSMKMLLMSAGVVSVAAALKFSVRVAANGIPELWSTVLLWMKPPYLYIIINGIIITVAASSRFNKSRLETSDVRSEHLISVKTPPTWSFASSSAQPDIRAAVEESTAAVEVLVPEIEDAVAELEPVTVDSSEVDIETEKETLVETETELLFVDHKATYNTSLPKEITSPERQLENLLPVREKPPVSSRFGRRKPIRTTPEVSGARALRLARRKKQETLESTWKMITEGRHVPFTRRQKKLDSWERGDPAPAVDEVPESESLKERSNNASVARIRKEASVGRDELNRRVEAFIKKFNEEMRMQRQESLNRYLDIINRGV